MPANPRSPFSTFLIGLIFAGPLPALADGDTNNRGRSRSQLARHAPTVVCQVPGKNVILRLVPSGTRVSAGDTLCELDPSPARANLARAELEARRTVAERAEAELNLEAALLALEEEHDRFREEADAADHAVALAEAKRNLARTRLAELEPETAAGTSRYLAELEHFRSAERGVFQARAKRTTLLTVEHPRENARLDAAVLEARSAAAASRASAALAAEAVERARVNLTRCRVVAPVSGQALHARWRSPQEDEGYALLEPGAQVVENQVLFRVIPDPTAWPPLPPPVRGTSGS